MPLLFDMPFAIIRYDRKAGMYVHDEKYTDAMMRANGAALLVAGRAGKQ